MARPNRLPILLLLMLLVVPFAAACGAAEEPAATPAQEEEAAPAEEPQAAEEPAPAEEPMPEEQAAEPQEPQLVGEIRTSGEDLEWGTPTQETAPYTWTVRVTNDTTATLDINVRFQLLDENDGVIKTETATVRLQPAQSQTIRKDGSIPYDQANNVVSFAALTDYTIVES